MKKHIIPASLVAMLFAACSGSGTHQKTIVVMASGQLTVTDKTIKLEPSFSHNEQTLNFTDDKLSLTLQNTDGPGKTFDLTENGVYVLNLQKDTLIGGLVNYGSTGIPGSITAEKLDHIIDSTKLLMQGLNASDAKRTYFIPPFSIKKVGAKSNTKIIGSFKGIPYSNEADGSGSIPDVIKFSTNKEKRETLKDLEEEKTKIK
ncbi:MAG: hypothetical protein ABI813_10515 [Bacteroidota bacterium]